MPKNCYYVEICPDESIEDCIYYLGRRLRPVCSLVLNKTSACISEGHPLVEGDDLTAAVWKTGIRCEMRCHQY